MDPEFPRTSSESADESAESSGSEALPASYRRTPEDILPNVTGSDCFMDSLLVAMLLPSSCAIKSWLADNHVYGGGAWGSSGGAAQRWPTVHSQALRAELKRIQRCLREEEFCGEDCRATLTAGTDFESGQHDPAEWLMHLLEQSQLPGLFKTQLSEVKVYENLPKETTRSFQYQYILSKDSGFDTHDRNSPKFPLLYRDVSSPNEYFLKEKLRVTDYVSGHMVVFTPNKLSRAAVKYFDAVRANGMVTLQIRDYKKRVVTLQLVSIVCWRGMIRGARSGGHYTCFVYPPSGKWHFFDDLGGGFKMLGAPPPMLFDSRGVSASTGHTASSTLRNIAGWDPSKTGSMFFYTLLHKESTDAAERRLQTSSSSRSA